MPKGCPIKIGLRIRMWSRVLAHQRRFGRQGARGCATATAHVPRTREGLGRSAPGLVACQATVPPALRIRRWSTFTVVA